MPTVIIASYDFLLNKKSCFLYINPVRGCKFLTDGQLLVKSKHAPCFRVMNQLLCASNIFENVNNKMALPPPPKARD